MSDQAVQVGVSGALNVQVATADIVQSLVVKAESTVSVFQESMGGENRVVGLNNSSRHLGRRRDGEGELGLASVVDRKTLQKERSKTRPSTSSSRMEDKKSLKPGTVVSKLADTIQNKVNNLLANGVVTTRVVVGSILLSVDDLLRMVQLGVGASTDFVTNRGLEIDVDGTGDMLSGLRLAEERGERIIGCTQRVLSVHVTIRGNAMLKAVQFPALVTSLDTGLTQVDGDTFYRQGRNDNNMVRGDLF